MKELFVGVVVVILMGVLSGLALLLLPLFLVLGLLLKLVVGLLFVLFAVWCIGKATLMLMGSLKSKEPKPLP